MSIVFDGYQSGIVGKKTNSATPGIISNNLQPTYRGSDVSLVGGSAGRDFSAVSVPTPMPEEAVPAPVQQIRPGYTAISPNRHE